MAKRIIPAVLLIFCLLAALAGCGESTPDESAGTLALLIKRSDTEKIYVQRIIERYESQTGNHIKLVIVENEEFDRDIAEIFAGGDIPDLFFGYNDSVLEILDIPDHFYYLNGESWVDELTDSVKAGCLDKDGNILGLPFWENSLSGCYYNKTLLEEMGLRPAATQAEFDALCSALKAVGYTPLYWASNACNWMFQFGLDPIFADNPKLLEKLNRNEITYADIPAVTDMVTWLDNAAKKGWFNADYGDRVWDDIAPAMQEGKAVFLFGWDTWFDTNFKEGGKYSQEDFALMPVFMNTAEMGTYEGGNLNMLMVNKNSPRREQALEFLDFCASPENYNIAFEGVSTVSCFKNQTTNIQSPMVTDAMVSIQANQRVSTARPKIIGYSQNEVGAAVLQLFQGKTDVQGCIRLMDEYRISAAKKLGAEGF